MITGIILMIIGAIIAMIIMFRFGMTYGQKTSDHDWITKTREGLKELEILRQLKYHIKCDNSTIASFSCKCDRDYVYKQLKDELELELIKTEDK